MPTLVRILEESRNPDVLEDLALELGELSDERAKEALFEVLQRSDDFGVTMRATEALSYMTEKDALIEPLERKIAGLSPYYRSAFVDLLVSLDTPAARAAAARWRT